MRNFRCVCGNTVYFENSQCLVCKRGLGFLPQPLVMSAIEPLEGGAWRVLSADVPDAMWRQCRNYERDNVCNWMVPADDPEPFCRACRLNQLIPNLADPRNRVLWARIERAKRRLLYGLFVLKLPVIGRDRDWKQGLAFEFLQDPTANAEFMDNAGTRSVQTGHHSGLITINIAEADPSAREGMREKMGEQYRTLLGHFRHEIAHYYWSHLICDTEWHAPFRELYGDERTDYDQALRRYYGEGPRPDWEQSFISAYASAHPWEDWAETWAHYLHMMDTLETAHDYGFSIGGQTLRTPLAAPKAWTIGFDELLADWTHLTHALNALNRSMGLRDANPFFLTKLAAEKLRFVHRRVIAMV
ncbi:MAG: zinc-binding metallopeptidase family protein [Sulfuricaulis sp.]